MEKKNVIILVLSVLLTAALVGGGVYLWQQNEKNDSSESDSSQVEVPEETKSTETLPENNEPQQPVAQKTEEELIVEAMASKFNKPTADVDVEINESNGTHASGVVKFAGEVAGGWWLAVKDSSSWIIVADGNGTVLCGDIEPYDFPTDMVPECWDETTQTLIMR